MESIIVTVQQVKPGQVWAYRKTDSSWTILKGLPEGSTQSVTVKGVLVAEPRHGERLELNGEWKVSTFNGEREFHFRSAAPSIPADPYSMLNYAVEVTKGLGPARMAEIWRAYGKTWAQHPDLDGIDGVTASTRLYWAETLARLETDKAQANTMSFLIGHGCTMTVSLKAWEKWKADSIARVQADPYILADLPYCGFQTVDGDMRKRFGIGDTDPRRIDAAILYKMADLSQRVGTLVSETALAEAAADLITNAPELVPHGIDRLTNGKKLVRLAGGVALASDYANELAVWEWMKVAA